MKLSDDYIVFPLVVYKNCRINNSSPEYIRIFIDQNNNLIVNNHSVNNNIGIDRVIKSVTEELKSNYDFREIVYFVEWDIGLNVDQLKSQIFQIVRGIISYLNKASFVQFNNYICEIDDTELEYIDKKYRYVIGIGEYISLGPPPPPPIEN